ncbi:MAG: alkaline phosphatase family protein [Planctomycetota bacterium]|jgi:hypothetical protein
MKKIPVLHPFFFALFPIFFLFANNLGECELSTIYGLTTITLAVTTVAWLGLRYALASGRKAGLVLSLFWVLFASYGHVVNVLNRTPLAAQGLGAHVVVAPVYLALFGIGAFRAVRTKGPLVDLTKLLNVSAAFLLVFSGVRIAVYEVRARRAREAVERDIQRMRELAALREVRLTALDPPQVKRNIYYIILDAYGRSDILHKVYGYDDSEFQAFLKSRGFYVAAKSRTNYSYTVPSLASSLNYTYLDNPGGVYLRSDYVPLRNMLARSAVSELLRQAGYRFVCLDSGGQIENADVCMRPDSRNAFFQELLKTTAAGALAESADGRRTALLYRFERLPETAEMDPPVFVFAHIMCPHRPFLFDSEGNDAGCWGQPDSPQTNMVSRTRGITRSEHIRHYREQMTHVNRLIMEMVDGILEKSEIPPIIILQGDHGPEAFLHQVNAEGSYLEERMSVLNAYHLPDGGDALLYETITPVNTFRVIFKHYFGADVPLLPDRSWFSPPQHPWRLRDVTDEIGSPADLARFEALRNEDYFPDWTEETIDEALATTAEQELN